MTTIEKSFAAIFTPGTFRRISVFGARSLQELPRLLWGHAGAISPGVFLLISTLGCSLGYLLPSVLLASRTDDLPAFLESGPLAQSSGQARSGAFLDPAKERPRSASLEVILRLLNGRPAEVRRYGDNVDLLAPPGPPDPVVLALGTTADLFSSAWLLPLLSLCSNGRTHCLLVASGPMPATEQPTLYERARVTAFASESSEIVDALASRLLPLWPNGRSGPVFVLFSAGGKPVWRSDAEANAALVLRDLGLVAESLCECASPRRAESSKEISSPAAQVASLLPPQPPNPPQQGAPPLPESPLLLKNLRIQVSPLVGGNLHALGEAVEDSATPKATLLIFWGTWCIPCLQELPLLERLSHRYSSVVFTGLAHEYGTGNVKEQVRHVASKYGVTYPQLLAMDYAAHRKLFPDGQFPAFALFDSDGRLLWKGTGSLDSATWKGALVHLLESIEASTPQEGRSVK